MYVVRRFYSIGQALAGPFVPPPPILVEDYWQRQHRTLMLAVSPRRWGDAPDEIPTGGNGFAAPTIWDHGFEDQTYSRLTDNVNQTATAGSILSDEAARGTFALRLNIPLTPDSDGGGGAINYRFALHPPRPTDYWTRFALMFTPGLATSQVKLHRFRALGGSVPVGTVIFFQGRLSWGWDDFASGGGENFGPTIVVGTWYWLEIHYQFLGTSVPMHVQIYLDDVLLIDEDSDQANDGNTGMDGMIYNGTVNQGNTVATRLWIDGMGLSAQRMGVPA